jgi:hypothetical protein
MTDTKTSESMTARTVSMEGRTVQGSAVPWTPSRSALAARSLRMAQRVRDTDERRVALTRHMEQFPPLIGR